MAPGADIPRWRQRLNGFGGAVAAFERTHAIRADRALSEAEQGGLIQFFELAVELGAKTLALRLKVDGVALNVVAPVIVIREAARAGMIDDPDRWLAAVERRNIMSHTYDPKAFADLADDVGTAFLPMLRDLHRRLSAYRDE